MMKQGILVNIQQKTTQFQKRKSLKLNENFELKLQFYYIYKIQVQKFSKWCMMHFWFYNR